MADVWHEIETESESLYHALTVKSPTFRIKTDAALFTMAKSIMESNSESIKHSTFQEEAGNQDRFRQHKLRKETETEDFRIRKIDANNTHAKPE